MQPSFPILSLLARLPLPVLRDAGWLLGTAAWWVNRKRRHVTQTNVRIAFPSWTADTVRAVARRHIQLMGVSLLDRLWIWLAPLDKTVYPRLVLNGFEYLPDTSHNNQAVILLVPHFLGIECVAPAWVAACAARGLPPPRFTNVFRAPESAWQRALFRAGRGRFTDTHQFEREAGIRPIIKDLRAGYVFHCSPDSDHGAKDALFTPFFGLDAATVTVVPRLARMLGAIVVPARTTITATGYQIDIEPAWTPEMIETDAAGCAAMNAMIERWAADAPEQYLFSHRRYKTRPEGAARVY